MNKIKAAIIEDEVPAARLLHEMIQSLRPDWEVMILPGTIEESVEWFHVNPHPELLFLDIQLTDGVDGLVQRVDAVQQALAVGLGAAVHVDLTLQLAALVIGAELFQLPDQAAARGAGHHPAGLHGVHQQLQLGQVKGAAGQKIAAAPAPPELDVVPQCVQRVDVAVHALALAEDGGRKKS